MPARAGGLQVHSLEYFSVDAQSETSEGGSRLRGGDPAGMEPGRRCSGFRSCRGALRANPKIPRLFSQPLPCRDSGSGPADHPGM